MLDADEVNPFLGGDSRIRSLNRVRIVALPGLSVEPGIIGRTGYDLVSAQALYQDVAHVAAGLRLDGAAPDLLRQFERCFHQSETQALARQIARAYGRKLGFLLLMLKRADPENQAARPEWSADHWQFWQGITTIIVGGGMLAGRLGDDAIPAAQEVLARHGFAGVSLSRSPYAAYLPLTGLARLASPETQTMLVLDFGHTAIKRALAQYHQSQVITLHLLPVLPTVCDDLNATGRPLEKIQQQWQQMLAIIEESWRQVIPRWRRPASLGICLACYLFEGQPSPDDQGCYGSLQRLSPHLETFIRQEIARRWPGEVHLYLAHDGTAAALAHAGQPHSIVLTLGTAIGNGFPPPAEGCRPLAPGFQIYLDGEPL